MGKVPQRFGRVKSWHASLRWDMELIRERTKEAGKGFYTKLDLGIVKYHFEAAAGCKVES